MSGKYKEKRVPTVCLLYKLDGKYRANLPITCLLVLAKRSDFPCSRTRKGDLTLPTDEIGKEVHLQMEGSSGQGDPADYHVFGVSEVWGYLEHIKIVIEGQECQS